MDEYLRPNLLLKDELDYELRIRGVICDRPVAEKRKTLSRLLAKEREGNVDILKLVDNFFDINSEKMEIEKIIDSIQNLIADFEGPTSDSIYLRARARILHLTNRVLRFKPDPSSADYAENQKFRDESYASAMYLDADLHDKVKELVPPNPATSTPSHTQQHINTTQFQSSPSISHNNYFKSTPVHTLGITFDGDPKQVMSFIERVEEMAHARHISKVELFESASDLSANKAIFWLRHGSHQLQTGIH